MVGWTYAEEERLYHLYLKLTHKFGIEVPKTVAETINLDENNGDNLWQEVIAKEMKMWEQNSK